MEHAHIKRPPLRADGGLGVEPLRELRTVELNAVREHESGHHLVSRLIVGHAVCGSDDNAGRAAQRFLDRSGREVLAVDPDPVGVPSREVHEAAVVLVTEIARPVPAEASRVRRCVGVVVVALERADTLRVDDLADALLGIEDAASIVELGAWLFVPILVDDLDVGRREPERAGGHVDIPVDGHAAFGCAVRVDHVDTEAAGERRDNLRRSLIAERNAQAVVSVVGALRLRQ